MSTQTTAPTMGNLDKVRYSHADMIDALLACPTLTQKELAERYGYTQHWISNIMQSDAWKAAYAKRREELIDPTIKTSIEERFNLLAAKSLSVLMAKLDAPKVTDAVALKAAELGARGIGLGGFAGNRVQVDIHNQVDLRAAVEAAHARRSELMAERVEPAAPQSFPALA